MSLKKLDIPIAPHLFKFLLVDQPPRDGVFTIKKRIIPPRYHNPLQYRAYFINPNPSLITISVLTSDSKLYKLYSWCMTIDQRFTDKLLNHVAARFHIPGNRVSESIREFLALYNITESEYAFETAYKKWQRSDFYRQFKKKNSRVDMQNEVCPLEGTLGVSFEHQTSNIKHI